MNVTPDEFASALTAAQITILKYQPDKVRSLSIDTEKTTITVNTFATILRDRLFDQFEKHLAVFKLTDQSKSDVFKQTLSDYMSARYPERKTELPPQYEKLLLNQDPTKKREDAFYLTTPDERLSPIDAQFYLDAKHLKLIDARTQARTAIKRFRPRDPVGVSPVRLHDGAVHSVFNTYVPPRYLEINPDELPDELPPLVARLVNHLFPLEIERRYFWAWLRESLLGRTGVYLILCGAPGTGKNRLKILMRALHGHMNTVDLKEATLDRFNSQVFDCTLLWLDETKVTEKHESILKEMQNDTVAEERKGVDTTRATPVWFNSVMSNNTYDSNHIVFEGRKFVPLVVTKKRLEESMSPAEIDEFSRKVEKIEHPDFDQKFVAQTYRWVLRHGKPRGPVQWKNFEYKGPMFYRLAHTSMREWQRRTVDFLVHGITKVRGARMEQSKQGYRWSAVQEQISRKHKGRITEPGYAKVSQFLEVFADSSGQRVFKITSIPSDLMGDFWVKQILTDVKIISENDIEHEPDENIKPIAKQNNKPPIESVVHAERTPKKEKVPSRVADRRGDKGGKPVGRRGRPPGRRTVDERLRARRAKVSGKKT